MARTIASWRHYCVPTGFPITWVLVKPPYPVTLSKQQKKYFLSHLSILFNFFDKYGCLKITFLKIQWSISTFCPTVFKNSPKCPNDDQMFGKTVNLTNEFRRTMPNDLVILWSKFIKSLHLPGLNFQNSCWHMKIDRINRCFADFPSSYISTWKLLSIQVKKRKETISKDFSKLHPISWFFFPFPIVPIPSYISR